MKVKDDIVWIVDAMRDYQRSRKWIEEQIAAHLLDEIEIPGDRKKYISRNQIEKLLQPRIVNNQQSA